MKKTTMTKKKVLDAENVVGITAFEASAVLLYNVDTRDWGVKFVRQDGESITGRQLVLLKKRRCARVAFTSDAQCGPQRRSGAAIVDVRDMAERSGRNTWHEHTGFVHRT